MVYIWWMSRASEVLLVRERDLGSHEDPGPRDLPVPTGALRWARTVLLPLSSAMRVRTEDRVMALTYDDGPDPEHTPQILAALARRDVRATFFLLADAAERHPGLVLQILRSGHEVGLHGVDHTRLTDVSAVRAARLVREGKRRLEAVAGQPVRLYRPTYGAQGVLQFLSARALGMDVVYWTAWARDWVDDEGVAVAQRALSARHRGGILLLHDTTQDTEGQALALPTFSRGEVTQRVLDGLLDDGFAIVPAGRLLEQHPTVRAVTTQRPWVTARRRLLARRRGS